MLAANDLSCRRGERLLFSGISFIVQPGELLHVQGANGSGKTSLLRLLCGLSVPERGEILWHNCPPRKLGEDFLAAVTYLGHQNAIKEELSAVENIQVSASLNGKPVSDDEAYAALETMGLGDKADLQTKVLSQGQRRRVALARLSLSGSALWLLDEPLAALDAEGVTRVETLLDTHLSRGGMAVVTTHQPLTVSAGLTRPLRLESREPA